MTPRSCKIVSNLSATADGKLGIICSDLLTNDNLVLLSYGPAPQTFFLVEIGWKEINSTPAAPAPTTQILHGLV